MTPTDELVSEHKVILRMFGALRKNIDYNKMPQVVEFFQVFADKCHHGKEEKLLFPKLKEVNLPRIVSLAVILDEHARGRDHVRKIKWEVENKNTEEMQKELGEYMNLLTFHIKKEDEIMFPIAAKQLPQKTQDELSKGFKKVEKEVIGKGKHKEFIDLIDSLQK